MPIVAGGSARRKVRFPKKTPPPPPPPTITTAETGPHKTKRRTSILESQIMSVRETPAQIPSIYTNLPCIKDSLSTKTSEDQDETVAKCLPFLTGRDGSLRNNLNDSGLARLLRDRHVEYLYDSLEMYPEGFVSMDSSRPWMCYWALAGLTLLGEDVSRYRER